MRFTPACAFTAQQKLAFYARAFGAIEQFRLTEPGGRIGHEEIKIGPTTMMLSDEYPEHDIKDPRFLGGAPASPSICM
jgi:uncharacterized glyoxalase superfamily protein PhnB